MIVLIVVLIAINILLSIYLLSSIGKKSEFSNLEKSIREEINANRKEMAESVKNHGDSLSKQVIGFTQINEQKLNNIRNSVENRLKSLQEDNSNKLEKMRETVDEKLHTTLEKRLGESFSLVSERLEKVQKGLGEMQSLANGVGDLKKVLTNVKTRGTWGEIQLENLLEQILIPDQYERNVVTKKGSRESVEFAIKLPGKDEDVAWLPIDAKFPKEDYERLLDAQDQANVKLIEASSKALEVRIKSEAKDIRDKYINPPDTTDFGILYLATEGLYAEVLKRPGLSEILQSKYRVVITGPTTIAALLNSLQIGFKTLAIEKRASEVWKVLGAVKSEFSKFGDILEKTHKQISTVSKTLDTASRKSRTIERKLKKVQELPAEESAKLLESDDGLSESIRPIDLDN
jgi:DNA recombination protein RmuC